MASPRKSAFLRIDTPRNVHQVIPVLKVRKDDTLHVAICSPRVWGYATHWDGKRTIRCTLGTGTCICKSGQLPTRDKGFVLVANGAGQLLGFLELTPMAWHELQALSTNIDGLRGKVVKVFRQYGSMKGRLMVEPWGEYQGTHPLPKDRDPEPTLRRIHGLPDLD